ncbi:MAG: hypothetical protein JWP87_1790 [Labilithrix sp.]|nr:hypothetical protein [Labilithrix sp.]
MLSSHVPLGAALALALATASCAAPTNNEQVAVPAPPVEIDEPLSLSVDALDIRHGSLRIEASMADGSADVSMWLGDSCEKREVGRGIATRSGFAWSLARDEVARAIECNLVVRVRAVDDEGHRVRRTAELSVSVALQSDTADHVRLLRQESEGVSTKLTFLAPQNARRLHVGGSVIGVQTDEEYAGRLPRGAFASIFVVGNDDLARSMLGRRRITLLGEHFLATISVGSMTLDVSEPEPEVPQPIDCSGCEG